MENLGDNQEIELVAKRAHENMERVNKVLSCCEVKLVKEETEEKLQKILDIDTKDILIKETSSQYYDLQSVSKILKKLDISVKSHDGKKKLRSCSVTSLESEDSTRDYVSELKNYLSEMKAILGSIENTSIEVYNDESSQENVIMKNNSFFELVFTLQRIAREIAQIASTNNVPSDNFSLLRMIDDNFIDKLKQLDKCLGDMQQLDKNPIVNLERKRSSKFQYTNIINSILEAIENNSY